MSLLNVQSFCSIIFRTHSLSFSFEFTNKHLVFLFHHLPHTYTKIQLWIHWLMVLIFQQKQLLTQTLKKKLKSFWWDVFLVHTTHYNERPNTFLWVIKLPIILFPKKTLYNLWYIINIKLKLTTLQIYLHSSVNSRSKKVLFSQNPGQGKTIL